MFNSLSCTLVTGYRCCRLRRTDCVYPADAHRPCRDRGRGFGVDQTPLPWSVCRFRLAGSVHEGDGRGAVCGIRCLIGSACGRFQRQRLSQTRRSQSPVTGSAVLADRLNQAETTLREAVWAAGGFCRCRLSAGSVSSRLPRFVARRVSPRVSIDCATDGLSGRTVVRGERCFAAGRCVD